MVFENKYISKRLWKRYSDAFKDKVFIITGASSGIGLASAKLFIELGAKVVLAARSFEKLERECAKYSYCSDNILTIKVDVSKEDDCKMMVDKTLERFGRIDVLVNNAGISMRAMFNELDLGVMDSLMQVNFFGTVYCTKYALPYLLKSKGSVVGVISIAGYSALPARSAYSASKFAIRGFLDTLRIEHLYDDLNVLVFAPGYTASNIRNTALVADGSRQAETPLDEDKLMSAEECATYLADGLYKRKSEVILTALGRFTVWLHRFLPRLTDRLTYNYISKEENSPFSKK